MDGLSAAASVFAVLQATVEVVEYLKDAKNATKDCRHCQAEASNLHDLLNNLLFHINQRKKDESWFTNVRALTTENGPLDQYKQALEELLSRVEATNQAQRLKRRLVWRFTKDEVDSVLRRMGRLRDQIALALGMDHFKLSQSIKDDTTTVRSTLPAIQADTSTIIDTQVEQQDWTILQWLSPTDYPAQQHAILSDRQEGTAQWFLDSVEFKRWVNGEEKTLLCPGIPGAGKTMMAAVGVDHLHEMRQRDGNAGIAYVFCNYKVKLEQSASALFAALLKQLLQRRPDLSASIKAIYDRHRGGKAPPEEIYKALQSVCRGYGTVFLVIDALDEYMDTAGIHVQFLDKLLQLQNTADVRILLTSRFIPTIVERFKSSLTLEVRASEKDVRSFVQGQLLRLPACIRRDVDLQATIVNRVTEAADGMFLLAQLHVKSLYDKRNKASVLRTLDKISRQSGTLDEAYSKAYDEALERIDSQSPDDQSLAKCALCWISYAQRHLTIAELSCALAIKPGDRELDRNNLYDNEDIMSVCAGLVTTDEGVNTVRLVHYTTQEYFERKRVEWNPRAREDIATACLTYVCFDEFRNGPCDSYEAFKKRLHAHEFYRYSARFWGEHIRSVQDTPVSALALDFLSDPMLTSSATDCVRRTRQGYIRRPSEYDAKGAFGLHLAAIYGLEILTRLFLEDRNVNADMGDGKNMTPLLYAARHGHAAVVSQLLQIGRVDINAQDKTGTTPLMFASMFGHELVIRQLLETGKLETSLVDIRGRTALSFAAEKGHEAIVNLLLRTGNSGVNVQDKNGDTALSFAAWMGHEGVVKLLLDTGLVRINTTSFRDRTPLSDAAGRGHEGIVKLLLEQSEVEVDWKDKDGRTPVSYAAHMGHEGVLKSLLGTGKVEVDSKDGDDRTPLWHAVQGGHKGVVKLLLETGKVVADQKDRFGLTPLAHAERYRREGILEVLRQHAHDVE